MSQTLTKRYFLDECLRFRKIMQHRGNAIETIQKALEGLFFVFLNVAPNECDDDVRTTMASTQEEWSRRSALMIMAGHPIEPITDQIFMEQ